VPAGKYKKKHETNFLASLKSLKKAGFRIRIRIQIRINLSCWIRIQESKNDPKKIGKSTEFSFFEVLDVLF
jgi:hypothetical protein